MTNEHEELFVVLDEGDIQKLKDGSPVYVYVDGDECDKPLVIFTEKGFKEFNDFWGENDP